MLCNLAETATYE